MGEDRRVRRGEEGDGDVFEDINISGNEAARSLRSARGFYCHRGSDR